MLRGGGRALRRRYGQARSGPRVRTVYVDHLGTMRQSSFNGPRIKWPQVAKKAKFVHEAPSLTKRYY